MLTFPTSFPLPLMPESDANSAKHDRKDSTVSSTTDANYTITRPRATRKPQQWTYGWKSISNDDFIILDTFYQSVGKHDMFLFTPWTGPTAGVQTTVRITEKSEWQYYHNGWQGSLTFEEV